MSGVFVAVSVGSSGSAGANVQYITRERATLAEHEHVWTENVPEYADHRAELASGISYKERVADLKEYVRQMEEDELGRRQSGNGQVRTHYRAIYSFDRPVSDEKAKQMVSEHLRESFPKARVIAAIHRDQQHPHVHAQITARDAEGRKLHFDRQTYRTLDERWAKIYGREFGQQYEREHLAKKEEWRAYMREARLAKEQGREIPQRPQRVAHERNQAQERRQMHARQYGVTRDALESTTRIAQRRAVERERSTTQQEQPAQDRVQRSGAADQRLAGPAQGREQSVEQARADDGQLRAADRAIGGETRRGHQHDGARQHQSGREDAGDGGVPERTGRDQPAAKCQTQQVFKFDRASALQDERTG